MSTRKSTLIPHSVDESALRLNRMMSDCAVHDADYTNGKKRYDAKSVAYASQLEADGTTWAVARFDADSSGCLVPSEFEIANVKCPRTIGGEMRRRGLRRNEHKTHDASLDCCGIDVDVLRSQFDGIPEAVGSVSGTVESLNRILSTDDGILRDASAYVMLSRVMETRRRLAELDEALRSMSHELTDGIERADERCRRERRDERRACGIDEWQRKVANEIGDKVGVPFDGGTVGEYEDFVSRHRKSAGAPHTIGMTNRQRGFVSAIGRMLHVQHPRFMSVAEASAFIEQYEDAYKMARDAVGSE